MPTRNSSVTTSFQTRALQYLSGSISDNIVTSSKDLTSQDIAVDHSVNLAVCRISSCMLLSNIRLLPGISPTILASPDALGSVFRNQLSKIGDSLRQHYIQHPLSAMIDARRETHFISYES